MSPAKPGHRSTELRLALAMRGGVSLAVWMGGACREAAALRKAAGPGPEAGPMTGTGAGAGTRAGAAAEQDIYRVLLKNCGYEKVTIDVLAGTSAGGLNGVLLACHLVYGMRFDKEVRNLWLDLADLESLIRPSRPGSTPDSLLRGDEVFYTRLLEQLKRLICAAPAEPVAASVRLILTTTRLKPRADWVRPSLGQPLQVGQSRAYFRFRHRNSEGAPSPELTDFFPADGPLEAASRLAYAARTSSSFPGAFEPAQPVVARPPTADAPDFPPVNMWGISSETGCPDSASEGRVELVDGGLLDNIPVAWAIRAIAGAPAQRRVDRRLLFLQPVPPYPPEPVKEDGQRRATRLARLALKSLTIKTGAESLLDDAAEFQQARAAVERQKGLAGLLPSSLRGCRDAADAQLASYRDRVGGSEAERLIRLLESPTDITGPDPLPLPSPLGPLARLDARTPAGSVPYLAWLRSVGGELVLPEGEPGQPATAAFETIPGRGRSPMALARAVRLLLDWVAAFEAEGRTGNAEERTGSAEGKTGSAEGKTGNQEQLELCRKRLYACRYAIATLIAARDRLILRGFTDGLAAEAIAPMHVMAHVAGRLRSAMPAVPTSVEPVAWEAWAALLAAGTAGPDTRDSAASVGTASAGTASVHDALYTELWNRLGELGRDIGRTMSPGCRGILGRRRTDPVRGFEAFHEAASRRSSDMVNALAAAEVLLGPLRPDPLAEPTEIGFHVVSAANTSWATERLFGKPGSARELVDAKLSGNQLNNFAAFLSTRWRMSDWTWGRLDAAASMVSVVATDERLDDVFGRLSDKEMIEKLAALIPGNRLLCQTDSVELSAPGTPSDSGTPSIPGTAPCRVTDFCHLWDLWQKTAADGRTSTTRWDRVRHLLVELRQREILHEELPMVAALRDQGRGNDRPPIPQEPTSFDFDDAMNAFRDIGAETVPQLLRKREPRRAAVRLGLLAWSALQPSGRRWARLVRAVMIVLKPFVWLPPVFSTLAPLPTLAAAALLWLVVAYGGGAWFSPPGHGFLLGVFAVPLCALWSVTAIRSWRDWRWWLLGGLKLLAWLAPAVIGAVLMWVVSARRFADSGIPDTDWLRRWPMGVGAVLATGILMYVASQRAWHIALTAVVAGAVTALLQSFAAADSSWWAVLVTWSVLAVVALALSWACPRTSQAPG
ncbi:patatin-like protein [Streptomyces sp. NBC_00878]|uniref:patatin-like protein n=1 Tax=Streptomyces sp. NBC_00878 TaxID=2975854 RepID=UPI00225C11B2|nr:patatin-like protein [Streptomyces sp. NBC_00878]MCX4910692.1 patatin-like protein [Streptomyces sp. NBC_00878]